MQQTCQALLLPCLVFTAACDDSAKRVLKHVPDEDRRVFCRSEELNSDHCNIALEVLRITESIPCGAPPIRRGGLFTMLVSRGNRMNPDGSLGTSPRFYRNSQYRGFCGDETNEYLNPLEAGPDDWGKTVFLMFDEDNDHPFDGTRGQDIAKFNVSNGSISPEAGSLWGCDFKGVLKATAGGVEFWSFERYGHGPALGIPTIESGKQVIERQKQLFEKQKQFYFLQDLMELPRVLDCLETDSAKQ